MSEQTNGVQAEDVRTPLRLRAFYELLDQQAAEQGSKGETELAKNLLTAMVRAHGLLWASVQATYVLEEFERRIAELEANATWKENR